MSPRAVFLCGKTFDHHCHHRLNQSRKLGHVLRVPSWMEKYGEYGDRGNVEWGCNHLTVDYFLLIKENVLIYLWF